MSEETGATPRDYATRPIPTAESAGAATKALIMAANELTAAIRVMIGANEPHPLHRPLLQLEQCLAAWPDTPVREPAPSARTAHLARVDQLLDKAIQDATRLGCDHQAGEVAVRLLEHQAALLGLYPLGDS